VTIVFRCKKLSCGILLKTEEKNVKFGVLTVVSVEIMLFWDVTPCSSIDRFPCFWGKPLPSSSGWKITFAC
jgi:hypothetical protein